MEASAKASILAKLADESAAPEGIGAALEAKAQSVGKSIKDSVSPIKHPKAAMALSGGTAVADALGLTPTVKKEANVGSVIRNTIPFLKRTGRTLANEALVTGAAAGKLINDHPTLVAGVVGGAAGGAAGAHFAAKKKEASPEDRAYRARALELIRTEKHPPKYKHWAGGGAAIGGALGAGIGGLVEGKMGALVGGGAGALIGAGEGALAVATTKDRTKVLQAYHEMKKEQEAYKAK